MAKIRDFAITINAAVTASMVCDMPVHETGDLLVAFVNKDTASAFTTPANWNAIRAVLSAGAAGGVYTKFAASGAETVTFALTSETCCACIIAVQDPEAEITSAAAQVNVVAAAKTYTRTTGSWITDGFSAGQTVIMSGFTNAGNNGPKIIESIGGAGNSVLTMDVTTGLVNETGNGDELAKSSGLDVTAASGADDSTVPLTGIGLTTIANNCLILHGLSGDLLQAISAFPPWVNLFVGDTGANCLCAAYTYKKTAGAVAAPDHWAGVADDTRGVVVAVRPASANFVVPYIPLSTTPSTMISPLVGSTGTIDKGTYRAAASIAITSIAGKTVTGVVVGTTADSGYNPFRGSLRNAGASSTTNLNHVELPLAASINLTTLQGLLFGTYLNLGPRDYLDTGQPARGGIYIVCGSSTTAWRAWVIGGQFSITEKPDARNNFLIEVGSNDTIYGSAGSPNYAAALEFAFGGSGYYGANSILWNELYSIGVVNLAGGTVPNPVTFDDIIFVVNNGCGYIPLMQQAGALVTMWAPLQFGGVETINVSCNLNTFQYPRKADGLKYCDFHLTANKIGVEFYGINSSDSFIFTNCLFTSPNSYYWRFNASHSAASAIDFSGSTVVNASVTLRATSPLDLVTFINCGSFVPNGAALTNCRFSNTKVSAGSPAHAGQISDSTFISGGTGHAIEVGGTAGDFTLAGVFFNGYGADDTTNAAIFVNIGSGELTIFVTGGGDVPTIRSAGCDVTVEAAVELIITASVSLVGAEIRIYDLDNIPVGSLGTELAGVESHDAATFVYSGTAANLIWIQIMKSGYVEFGQSTTIPATDGTFFAILELDTNA